MTDNPSISGSSSCGCWIVHCIFECLECEHSAMAADNLFDVQTEILDGFVKRSCIRRQCTKEQITLKQHTRGRYISQHFGRHMRDAGNLEQLQRLITLADF